ncbi:MAG: hypothetical protein Q8K75_11845 [Chlamydiales bacterium]|nr:hypothetical protein [Chlamydiales bacterium]
MDISSWTFRSERTVTCDKFRIFLASHNELHILNPAIEKSSDCRWSKIVLSFDLIDSELIKKVTQIAPTIFSVVKEILTQSKFKQLLDQTACKLRTKMLDGLGKGLRETIAEERTIPVLKSFIANSRDMLHEPQDLFSSMKEIVDLVFPVTISAQRKFAEFLSLGDPDFLEPPIEIFNGDDPSLTGALYEETRYAFANFVFPEVLREQLLNFCESSGTIENYLLDSLIFENGSPAPECAHNLVDTMVTNLECLATVITDTAIDEINNIRFTGDTEKLICDVIIAFQVSQSGYANAPGSLKKAVVQWLVPTDEQLQIAIVNSLHSKVFQSSLEEPQERTPEGIRKCVTQTWIRECLPAIETNIIDSLDNSKEQVPTIPRQWRSLIKSVEGLRKSQQYSQRSQIFSALEQTRIPEAKPVEPSLRSSIDRETLLSTDLHITSSLIDATPEEVKSVFLTWLRQDPSQKISLYCDLADHTILKELNNLINQDPSVGDRITALYHVDNAESDASDQFTRLLSRTPNLTRLHLENMNLTKDDLRAVTALARLNELCLSGSSLDPEWTNLCWLPIEKLDLSNSGVSQSSVEQFISERNVFQSEGPPLELTTTGLRLDPQKLRELYQGKKLFILNRDNAFPLESALNHLFMDSMLISPQG